MTAMRGTWVLAVLAAGVVACGGGNGNGKDKVTSGPAQPVTAPPTVPAPEPVAEGPACAEMAAKVIATIAAERSEQRRAEVPAMTEVVRKRCEEDRWTADNRRCMAGAATRDDAKRCFEQLTPAQQESMERAEAEMPRAAKSSEKEGAADGAAAARSAAPPPPPPAPVMAPPKESKKRSKGGAPKPSDPCEGGE